jgi:hypothetical protein
MSIDIMIDQRAVAARIAAGVAMVGLIVAPCETLGAQISRHPTGVNVSAVGATTVFLTFGNLEGKVPVEALWCGELISAAPAVGQRCDPATIFGSLPLRYDQARTSGIDGLTDIMSIPPSVARRAYQAAREGEESSFFYVRRFVDPAGGPDEYVTVTCRLTDGGARTPFSLTNVTLEFATDAPVVFVGAGERLPPMRARVNYTGSGRLRGRWEIVRPGEEPPRHEDLLPEASLPLELRGTQRRFAEISRFDVALPPVGEIELEGPDPAELPTDAAGAYQILLRVEASDDKEAESSLDAAGAGSGRVAGGGAAGFALPTLRYAVGRSADGGVSRTGLSLEAPNEGSTVDRSAPLDFSWRLTFVAPLSRLEVRTPDGAAVFAAVLDGRDVQYRAPSWLLADTSGDVLEWRVVTIAIGGRVTAATPWRRIRLSPPPGGTTR